MADRFSNNLNYGGSEEPAPSTEPIQLGSEPPRYEPGLGEILSGIVALTVIGSALAVVIAVLTN